MTHVIKTRTILGYVEVRPGFAYLERERDGEDDGRTIGLTIDHEAFLEMGSPHQITLTIEPGDLLNNRGEPMTITTDPLYEKARQYADRGAAYINVGPNWVVDAYQRLARLEAENARLRTALRDVLISGRAVNKMSPMRMGEVELLLETLDRARVALGVVELEEPEAM